MRIALRVYVRDQRGRVIEIETTQHVTVSWLTTVALIKLNDRRDATSQRLLLADKPLNPKRTLKASGVRHGDTLRLVNAPRRAVRRWHGHLHRRAARSFTSVTFAPDSSRLDQRCA